MPPAAAKAAHFSAVASVGGRAKQLVVIAGQRLLKRAHPHGPGSTRNPTPEAAARWSSSATSPSEMSMHAEALPRRARPKATRGRVSGRPNLREGPERKAPGASPEPAAPPARQARPENAATKTRSPALAPLLSSAWAGGTQPVTVTETCGPCARLPPTRSQPGHGPLGKPARHRKSCRSSGA